MKHLDEAELSQLLDGELRGHARERADRHLAECATCRESLERLTAEDRALASALVHEPGDEYFEGFAARVQERLHAEPTEARRPASVPWLAGPRWLAWAGGVAVLVVGVGLVFLTVRESPMTDLRDRSIAQRSGQVADGRTPAPQAAAPEGQVVSPPVAEEAPAPGADMAAPVPDLDDRAADSRLGATSDRSSSRDQANQTMAKQAPADANRPAAPATGARSTPVRRDARGEERPRSQAAGSFASPPPAAREKEALSKPAPAPLTTQERQESATRAPSETPSSLVVAPPTESKATEPRYADETRLEAKQASSRLCGTVRDRNGRPVAGAQVVITDRGAGVVSDAAGRYCIPTPAGSYTLTVMAFGYEPVRRVVTVAAGKTESDVMLHPVRVLDAPLALTGGAKTDPFASWPSAARAPAQKAQQLSDQAAQQTSAATYDQAADAWQRTLEKTQGGDAELDTRTRLADARYRAWEIAPTTKRAGLATEALTALLTRAPAGPARDLAARRLNLLRR
jgi:anti-sigma factor RsiW